MDGILIVNKPKGITSHDVVSVVRRRFNIKRIGHAGTLDPIAEGVLVLLIGKATKLADKFINSDKEYIAGLYLGKNTDTQDSTGKIIEEKPIIGDIGVHIIKQGLSSFVGDMQQIPPMISAKKYKGVRLYKLARKGKVVDRKPCKINISDIELLNINLPEILFRVVCSKGTYVRSLCEDIGKALGYPAHMKSLKRIRSGRFTIQDAYSLNDIKASHVLSI